MRFDDADDLEYIDCYAHCQPYECMCLRPVTREAYFLGGPAHGQTNMVAQRSVQYRRMLPWPETAEGVIDALAGVRQPYDVGYYRARGVVDGEGRKHVIMIWSGWNDNYPSRNLPPR